VLSYKIEFQVKGLAAKQVVMVWACAAKKDNDWVKKYGV